MSTDLAAKPLDRTDGEEVRPSTYTANARRLDIVSASGTVLLSAAYAIPLTAGLLSLPSPDTPIGDPWFPMMEIMIIVTMPVSQSGPCGEGAETKQVDPPRSVAKQMRKCGLPRPRTFGGRLDVEHAIGSVSRWLGTTGRCLATSGTGS